MNLKSKIKKKIKKRIKKFFQILPEHSQELRFEYYKSLSISFSKVLDVGAYIGSWKDMFQKIFPNAEITMIEANLEKEAILKKKGKYFIALLGEEDNKVMDYYRCSNEEISSGNGVFRENTSFKFFPEKRSTTKLTTLLKGEESYDLIKIDTQGSELSILKGAIPILDNTKFLLLELSIVEYNFNAPNYFEVIEFLKKHNFKLIDMFDMHYRNGSLIQFDGFFINTKFRDLVDLIGSKHI